jgi:hypothetical protein
VGLGSARAARRQEGSLCHVFLPDRATDVQEPRWRAGILRGAGRDYAEYGRKVFSAPIESSD